MAPPAPNPTGPDPAPMPVGQLDDLPTDEVVTLFGRCLAVDRWARELADGRPYPDRDTLLATADRLSASLTDGEVRHALDDHPRIGQRPASTSATADWSTAEQSGVDRQDVSVAERLLAGNAAYEERFGHIYLVCASGRDAEDLLADLSGRIGNDPVTELSVVRVELGRIARLRLGRIVLP